VHPFGTYIVPPCNVPLGIIPCETCHMHRLAPIGWASHRCVAMFDVKATGVTNVPDAIFCHHIGMWEVHALCIDVLESTYLQKHMLCSTTALEATTACSHVVSKRHAIMSLVPPSLATSSCASAPSSLIETSCAVIGHTRNCELLNRWHIEWRSVWRGERAHLKRRLSRPYAATKPVGLPQAN
jgi:hypothetical protein